MGVGILSRKNLSPVYYAIQTTQHCLKASRYTLWSAVVRNYRVNVQQSMPKISPQKLCKDGIITTPRPHISLVKLSLVVA